VSQENMDDTEENDDPQCPFCGDKNVCEHLLFVVDATFRDVLLGELYEAFTKRWADLQQAEEDNPKFDEGQEFDDLLEEVKDLADAQLNYGVDQMPGMSSAYQAYYCKTKDRTREAVEKFVDAANLK
jgi:hypothetical protein